MNKKLNYIKKGAKYIIGATILAISLGSASFGLLYKDNKDYYKIYNSDDLMEFADKVNKGNDEIKGKLCNDINFKPNSKEWTPIGTFGNAFNGELISDEGKKYKITGLYINKETDFIGLFGVIGKDGKVRDISVIGPNITGKNYVGGIAGFNVGIISGCDYFGDHFKGKYIIKGANYVGGIAGVNDGTISDCNCSDSNITGKEHVGGITGYNNTETISDCTYSDSNITGTQYVGGIAGFNHGKVINGKVINNYPLNMKVLDMKVSGCAYVGGIVGFNEGSLESCQNAGTIESNNETIESNNDKGKYFGGIVGFNTEEVVYNTEEKEKSAPRGTIIKPINNGKVNVKEGSMVGGIIGYNNGYLINDNLNNMILLKDNSNHLIAVKKVKNIDEKNGK